MARIARGFTLLELLIAVAVIGLLVAITAVALESVKKTGGRVRSLGALRQMALGHQAYGLEQRNRLIPGYIEAGLFAEGRPFHGLQVRAPDGTLLEPAAAQSWVWRLAPYVDGSWRTFFADLNDGSLLRELETDYAAGIYGPGSAVIAGGISERPSFGINSRFVGRYYEENIPSELMGTAAEGTPSERATRITDVKTADRVILFAPSVLAHIEGDRTVMENRGGYHEVLPPYT